MATSTCAVPIKGTHLRIIALDACGIPVTGTGGLVVVTEGFVQVEESTQYEDGEKFFKRTASGAVCVNDKDDPTLTRMELTVEFCEVNVLAVAYVLNARVLGAGTPVTGTGFAVAEGTSSNRFSIEVWQKVSGAGQCDATGAQRYIYNVWPNVGATQLDTYTIENGPSSVKFKAETKAASSLWLGIAGNDWLPVSETIETDEHWLWNVTTTPPPTAACDSTTLP